MRPIELAYTLEQLNSVNIQAGQPTTSIYTHVVPLLVAALRGMEAVDEMARKNATMAPPLPNEGLSPAEYEALVAYRAAKNGAASAKDPR